MAVLAGGIALCWPRSRPCSTCAGRRFPRNSRFFCSASPVLAWWRPTGQRRAGFIPAHRGASGGVFFRRFIASLLDPLSWRQFGGLALSDIAEDPLPLMAAVPARTLDYPDIIVIQHESIFDPRIFGLPVEPIVEAFLSPKNGLLWKPQRRYFWRRIVAIRIQPADRPFQRELRFKRLFSFQARRRPIPQQSSKYTDRTWLQDNADVELPPQLSQLR